MVRFQYCRLGIIYKARLILLPGVDEMFARGLVEETGRALHSPAARQGLGYRQVVEHLEGKRNLEQTIALVKLRTRQYAKRQLTWFRHQANAQWIDADHAIASVEREFGAFSRK